jgi:hypothetical protein
VQNQIEGLKRTGLCLANIRGLFAHVVFSFVYFSKASNLPKELAVLFLQVISPYSVYFNAKLIFQRFQLWRLFTNFFYFGHLGESHVSFQLPQCMSDKCGMHAFNALTLFLKSSSVIVLVFRCDEAIECFLQCEGKQKAVFIHLRTGCLFSGLLR